MKKFLSVCHILILYLYALDGCKTGRKDLEVPVFEPRTLKLTVHSPNHYTMQYCMMGHAKLCMMGHAKHCMIKIFVSHLLSNFAIFHLI
jgi:hypothetical protein